MSMPKQIAITLRRLETRDTHDSIDEFFGMNNLTIMKACKKFIIALINIALLLYLK